MVTLTHSNGLAQIKVLLYKNIKRIRVLSQDHIGSTLHCKKKKKKFKDVNKQRLFEYVLQEILFLQENIFPKYHI